MRLLKGYQLNSVQRQQQDVEMLTVANGMSAARTEDSDVAAERQRIIGTQVDQLATTDAS